MPSLNNSLADVATSARWSFANLHITRSTFCLPYYSHNRIINFFTSVSRTSISPTSPIHAHVSEYYRLCKLPSTFIDHQRRIISKSFPIRPLPIDPRRIQTFNHPCTSLLRVVDRYKARKKALKNPLERVEAPLDIRQGGRIRRK